MLQQARSQLLWRIEGLLPGCEVGPGCVAPGMCTRWEVHSCFQWVTQLAYGWRHVAGVVPLLTCLPVSPRALFRLQQHSV